jgi:hypothetical protein
MDQRKKKIAIVALGPSMFQYVQVAEGAGDKSIVFDEVWGINTVASVLKADLIFHMDDVRVQMARAPHNPKIAALVDYLYTHQGRVITSRAHPDFPCLEPFPLQEVVNDVKSFYFNNTVAYPIAYAMWRGDVGSIFLYGCDYNYQNSNKVEPGRACLEFWLGRAWERGIEIAIASSSSLMDTNRPCLYGYDTLKVGYQVKEDGTIEVSTVPKDEPIDGKAIEERYDHSRKVA